MNVIAIEELAKVIANKHHLTQQEADAFINAFFKNIRNALATEKLVKIKGLGTFAVAVMKSTEYPGRKCKVMTFSPEPKLSKQINKPFAQFEVVTLAEGVTFDDVTEETGDDSLVKTVAKEEISVDDLPMVDSWVMVEMSDTSDLMEEQLPVMSDETTSDDSGAADTDSEDSNADSDSTHLEGEQEPPVLVGMSDNQDAETTGKSADTPRSSWWKWAVGVAIAACLLIGFFLLKPSNDAAQPDTNTTSDVALKTSDDTKDSTPTTSEESSVQNPEDQYAAENELCKYGAYKIVGLDTIITVTPGMDLQRIATIFLGSEMQMYLTAMNNGNDNPQVGEQYKIPKIELK